VALSTRTRKPPRPAPSLFARSLPLEKAIADSTILAYSMNEEPLTRDHGYPLRAVVGGWFGMAWVKWITHITVVERPFLGYWQARDYFRWERSLGQPTLVPLAEMEVKAQIAHPVQGRASNCRPTVSDFSEPPGAERLPSGRCRFCAGRWQRLARGEAPRNGKFPLHGACGSACGPLNKWGDTYCDVARSMRRGRVQPDLQRSDCEELRGQLDRSGRGNGRSRTTDVRGGIRDLITSIVPNGGYRAHFGTSRGERRRRALSVRATTPNGEYGRKLAVNGTGRLRVNEERKQTFVVDVRMTEVDPVRSLARIPRNGGNAPKPELRIVAPTGIAQSVAPTGRRSETVGL